MHRVLAALHQGNRRRLPIVLLFGRHAGRSGLYLRYPIPLRSLVEKQLQGEYPGVDLDTRLANGALDFPPDHFVWSCRLSLRPDLFPIIRYNQWEEAGSRVFSDPLTAILEALAPAKGDPSQPRVEITIRPAGWWLRFSARTALRRLAREDMQGDDRRARRFALWVTSRWRLVRIAGWLCSVRRGVARSHAATDDMTTTPGRMHEHERAVQAAGAKLGDFLFEAHVQIFVGVPTGLRPLARQRLRELAGVLSASALPHLASWRASRMRRSGKFSTRLKWKRWTRGSLLSAEELATLFHPATHTVGATQMHANESRKLEPPIHLPIASKEEDVLPLGRVLYRDDRQHFGIRLADRGRHIYIPGKTGMGKSTLIQSMIVADIHAGRGIGLIDPHGDLADRVLRSLPRRRWDDLVLFDPADVTWPIAFNPLDCTGLDATQRVLRADALLSVFKKLYADSFQAAARMEDIFRNSFLALVEDPNATLLSLTDLLHNAPYRTWLARRLVNPVVRDFWLERFPSWTSRYHAEAVAPVENKVRGLTSNPILQGILGQSRNRVNLRHIMDEGKIIVANLSKGNCGENASLLLGSLLVSMTQQAAQSRADIPEEARRDFFLYVDEFQNVVTESFATILSEARKYRLNVTLANQFLGQLQWGNHSLLPAIFGNVGTLISFAVGPEDAELLCEAIGESVTTADLVHLPKYHAYIALAVDGKTSDPFLMRTILPPEPSLGVKSLIALRARSRERYCQPARLAHHAAAV